MLQAKKKLAILFLYSTFLIITSVIVGYQIRTLWPPEDEHLALLREAQSLISDYYLGELPEEIILERGMIRGMVAEIGDPYTIYIEPSAFEIRSDTLSGEYGGIGASLSLDDQGRYHLFPFEGSPASLAGIEDGDILLSVDGVMISNGMNQDEVLSMIRGLVGTTVTLMVMHQDSKGDSIVLNIERKMFPIPSVSSHLLEDDNRIAVIDISIFSEQTPREVEQAYVELMALGAKAVILDLRDNAGGLLESAVDVTEFFLHEGTILFEQQKDRSPIQYRVNNPGIAQDVPLVVIVNEATASSAEVVAAALQTNERAPLIGNQTFGKGSVQSILVLKDGSSLYITSARWMTPNMERLDHQGLEPDVVVSSEAAVVDLYIQAATNFLQEILLGES